MAINLKVAVKTQLVPLFTAGMQLAHILRVFLIRLVRGTWLSLRFSISQAYIRYSRRSSIAYPANNTFKRVSFGLCSTSSSRFSSSSPIITSHDLYGPSTRKTSSYLQRVICGYWCSCSRRARGRGSMCPLRIYRCFCWDLSRALMSGWSCASIRAYPRPSS